MDRTLSGDAERIGETFRNGSLAAVAIAPLSRVL
jgi:hypothetical protein